MLTFTRGAQHASYDFSIEGYACWSGDEALISELRSVLRQDGVGVSRPEFFVPFSTDTPLHNVLAAAMSLELEISDSELDITEEVMAEISDTADGFSPTEDVTDLVIDGDQDCAHGDFDDPWSGSAPVHY